MVEKQETLKVKTHWSEVTLEEFLKIGEIQGDEEMQHLALQKRLRMIAVITNRTYEQICEYSGDNLLNILEAAAFLDIDPPKRNKPKPFTIDGIEYMFHPDFKNLTGGEMISVEQLLMDGHHNDKNVTAEVLAVLIRPTEMIDDAAKPGKQKKWIQKFDAETLMQRRDILLKQLTADNFMNELSFFFANAESKGNISKLYSALLNPKAITEKNRKKK